MQRTPLARRPADWMVLVPLFVGATACHDDPITAPPPATATCPAGLPTPASCYRGEGVSGAAYVIAVPDPWKGVLVLFNRGATPVPLDSARVFGATRFLLAEGVAVAASAYRSDTPLAREAADDTDELRRIFTSAFGKPTRTILFGLSFGSLVTVRCAELFRGYDGAFAGCGLVGGSRESYYPLLDLRLVYQHYCRNLPRPTERQYDLYLGNDPQSPVSIEEVRSRANDCTGIGVSAAQRTAEQRANLANILAVVRIPESYLLTNLEAAVILLPKLVTGELAGRTPIGNASVVYAGSTDDGALNRDIARYTASASAAATFIAADDPTGKMSIPVVTLHAVDDGRAYVENEAAYRATVERGGNIDRLFQAYTTQGGHCQFTQPESLGLVSVLMDWIETGTRPTTQALAAACDRYRVQLGGACRFNTAYQPAALTTRMYAR